MKELDPKTANMLLKFASAKLGKSPEDIKSAISENNFDKLTGNMSEEQSKKLNSFLNNPEMMKKVLNSSKTKDILDSLNKQ